MSICLGDALAEEWGWEESEPSSVWTLGIPKLCANTTLCKV